MITVCLILSAFGIGLWIGREVSEIKYQRRVVDLQADAAHWRGIALKARGPIPPGIEWPSDKMKT